MKKILLVLFLLMILISNGSAQSKMNFDLIKKINADPSSLQLINIFVKGNPDIVKQLTLVNGGNYNYSSGDISVISIPINKILLLENNRSIQRIEAYTSHIKPLNDTMVIQTNVSQVHNGVYPLTQGYDGTGIVVGIIDTGIDFTHPDFKDSLGKTRIKYLWDQTKAVAANTPQPYNYGQEWTNSQIDNGQCTQNDLPYAGHGTHAAGIAVGNGLALNKFKGVAPKADIVFVTFNFNSTSSTLMTDAVNYIYSKAQMLGKPCVINASLGDAYGSHDGQDLQAQLIKNMINARSGQAFVAAAGNDGNKAFHLGETVTSDTNFTMFKYNSSNTAAYIQLWADTANFKNVHFSIGADKMTPVHSYRGNIPFSSISSRLGILHLDTLYKNGNRIGIVESYGDLLGGTYSMEFYITTDSTAYNWRLITTGSGNFDSWSYDLVSSNLPSLATLPDSMNYKLPDKNQTIVSSFQCLDNVITVGNYINRKSYIDYSGNPYIDPSTQGERHVTSSAGPTRDGRIKPEICAPGNMTVAAAVLSLIPNFLISAPTAVAQGGMHMRSGGTSFSSPCVAGVAALYLQKNPTATAMEVKNAIIGCTIKDNFTGTALPNNYWGYGKINAFGALTNCVPVGIQENEIKPGFSVFPNPSASGVIVNIDLTNINLKNKNIIKIYNTLGEEVKSIIVTGNSIKLSTELKTGIYLFNLIVNGSMVSSEKLIIL